MGLFKAETTKLDAFHIKQLRRLMGIKYTTKSTMWVYMENAANFLYQK